MSEIDKLRAELRDMEQRVIRLENLQQDPTAYRHTSEPRAWAAVESLIATGVAPGAAVEEMKAKFPILVLLQERMEERVRLLAAVNNHKATNDLLREEVTRWKNDLGACDASRLASEKDVDRLRSRLRKLQRGRYVVRRRLKIHKIKKKRSLKRR